MLKHPRFALLALSFTISACDLAGSDQYKVQAGGTGLFVHIYKTPTRQIKLYDGQHGNRLEKAVLTMDVLRRLVRPSGPGAAQLNAALQFGEAEDFAGAIDKVRSGGCLMLHYNPMVGNQLNWTRSTDSKWCKTGKKYGG